MCESLCIVSKWLPQGWYEPPYHTHTHTHPRPVVTWSSLCIFTVDCTVWIVTKQTAFWAFKAGRVSVCQPCASSPPFLPSTLPCAHPVGLTFHLFTPCWRHTSHSGFPWTLSVRPLLWSVECVLTVKDTDGDQNRPCVIYSVWLLLSIRVYLGVCKRQHSGTGMCPCDVQLFLWACMCAHWPATLQRQHLQWGWGGWRRARQRQWRSPHLPQTKPVPETHRQREKEWDTTDFNECLWSLWSVMTERHHDNWSFHLQLYPLKYSSDILLIYKTDLGLSE